MFSSNVLKGWSFQKKKNALEYDLFSNIWKDGISFLPKIWFFFVRQIFSRKNPPKGDISGITEKYDIHPRKYGISVEITYWLIF